MGKMRSFCLNLLSNPDFHKLDQVGKIDIKVLLGGFSHLVQKYCDGSRN